MKRLFSIFALSFSSLNFTAFAEEKNEKMLKTVDLRYGYFYFAGNEAFHNINEEQLGESKTVQGDVAWFRLGFLKQNPKYPKLWGDVSIGLLGWRGENSAIYQTTEKIKVKTQGTMIETSLQAKANPVPWFFIFFSPGIGIKIKDKITMKFDDKETSFDDETYLCRYLAQLGFGLQFSKFVISTTGVVNETGDIMALLGVGNVY
jgi:hypothetical protein